MNFKILKSKLSEPLSLLASVAESRQSIPILSNIFIKAEKDLITLIATDLEIELSFKIDCDAIILCLPTPIKKNKSPQMKYIKNSLDRISKYFRKGQILSLESTTYPGTTEEIIRPFLTLSFEALLET